jgi:hypothetical protein
MDLNLANGHPDDFIGLRTRGVTYREPMVLFHNEGNGKLVDVSESEGNRSRKPGVSVGSCFPNLLDIHHVWWKSASQHLRDIELSLMF